MAGRLSKEQKELLASLLEDEADGQNEGADNDESGQDEIEEVTYRGRRYRRVPDDDDEPQPVQKSKPKTKQGEQEQEPAPRKRRFVT